MLRFALCFALGTLLFHQLPSLPALPWLIPQGVGLMVCVAGLVGLRGSRWPSAQVVVQLGFAGLLGFCWSHLSASLVEPPHLNLDNPRADVSLSGTVVGLPSVQQQLTRFIIEAPELVLDERSIPADWRLRLTWRDAPALRPGDRFTLSARLRAVHGYASPGAWDYEGWLYHQGIRYTGYVTAGAAIDADDACCRFDKLRDAIRQRIGDAGLSPFADGVVRALVVADRAGLDASAKAMFRDTGTSHLMAVSGLHIGLVSGAVALLVGFIWRRIPRLCERVPARLAAAGLALVSAALYAGLAGFGLPTQRALIMFSVLAAGIVLRRQSRVSHTLALAALLVLLWHPPSIVAAGFWLSFGAVAAIIATLVWTQGKPAWFRAMTLQLGVTIGLWPLLLLYGLPVSALAPLINLVAVPLFGVLVVPGSLLGSLLAVLRPSTGAMLLQPLGDLLDVLRGVLESAAALAWNLPSGAGISVMAIGLFVVVMLLPLGIPFRLTAVPLLFVAWLPRQPLVEEGAFHFSLLDVGQGLSVVIETRHHVLVYDTGPRYPSGFSTAEAVVVPFLRHRNRSSVDRVIASHGDSDHAGGLAELARAIPVDVILSGEPGRVGQRARRCVAGQNWLWDGVRFTILHPEATDRLSGNNASCVLHVENDAGAVLLTGDIEAVIEHRLMRDKPNFTDADLVVAAHHGSLSSSTEAFVAHASATHVLFARGWANRYGFPRDVVKARWADAGAQMHDTALDGTIGFAFQADGSLSGPTAYRRTAQRFWMHDVGSAKSSHAVSFDD